jgi:hypothetical protein
MVTVTLELKSDSPIDMSSALIDYYTRHNGCESDCRRNIVSLNELAEHIQSFCNSMREMLYIDKM